MNRPTASTGGEGANARISSPAAAVKAARTAGKRGPKRSVRDEAKKTDRQ